MKLRVVELLLISTIPAMILAQQGIPDAMLVLATLVGGTLAAGSANEAHIKATISYRCNW